MYSLEWEIGESWVKSKETAIHLMQEKELNENETPYK